MTTPNRKLRKLTPLLAVAIGVLLSFLFINTASAHETRDIDGLHGYQFVVGFETEPAYEGYPNAVYVFIKEEGADGHHAADDATTDEHEAEPLVADLNVEVFYNATNQSTIFPLTQRYGVTTPEYTAAFVPTSPGGYTFRLFGTINDEVNVDESFVSGPDTFNNVTPVSEVTFPATNSLREVANVAQANDLLIQDLRDDISGIRFVLYATIGAIGVLIAVTLLVFVSIILQARLRRKSEPTSG